MENKENYFLKEDEQKLKNFGHITSSVLSKKLLYYSLRYQKNFKFRLARFNSIQPMLSTPADTVAKE